ncbi:hypothetical protein Tco_1020100 [Tanacetum coccineum]|uniref:Uncharacterized protein n=1 Tax=Tanacetum coccineum TaxID=301880 RepID=A0ABQ5FZC0_9ASTR
MKRSTKGFSGQEVALFPTMLDDTEPSPSPSPTPAHTQPSPTQPSPTQPSPTQPSPTQPGTEYHLPTPYDSPLHAVHSHGSDEGSLKLQELMNLVTTLSDRIGVLEANLMKTYSQGQEARGRKLSDADVQEHEEVQEKASTETELFIQEVTPTEVILPQEGSEEVSTAGAKKGTATEEVPIVSTAEVNLSTAGGTVTYTRRSAKKKSRQDKGKAIMIEYEPKKKSKKEFELERLSIADAIKLEEQMNEEQRAQIARDEEIAKQWQEEEKKKAMDEVKSAKKIDWNDPSKVWDFNQNIEPMDAEHGPEKQKSPKKQKSAEKIKEVDEVKETGAKRKKSIPRKSIRKRQKTGLEELYRLVKERYSASRPEGFDLMLWGDLHTLFEPDEDEEIWKDSA